jgi:hypothetical protein
VVFLAIIVVGSILPVIVGLAVMAAAPLFGLGFMLASEAALKQQPVHPGLYLKPLTGSAAQRTALLWLVLGYGVAMFLAMAVGQWADGGAMLKVRQLQAQQASPAEVEAAMATAEFQTGLLVRFGLIALVSALYWHAPALVHWGRQGAAQALFSSALAMWRNKGAFVLFMLGWIGMITLFGLVSVIALTALGLPNLLGMVVIPGGLVLGNVYMVSMLFPFNDCFGNSPASAPPP